jgi:modulator of FtsH protease
VYPYQIASWTGFLSVAAQVAATLTGLIFVAISINLSRILEAQSVADRAAESIMQMFGALIVSIWALVPGQSSLVIGLGMAAAGLLLWILQTILQYRSYSRQRTRPFSSYALSQLATLPFCVAGISLATGTLGGLYWLAPGIILSITVGVSNAWVLLVEILR